MRRGAGHELRRWAWHELRRWAWHEVLLSRRWAWHEVLPSRRWAGHEVLLLVGVLLALGDSGQLPVPPAAAHSER